MLVHAAADCHNDILGKKRYVCIVRLAISFYVCVNIYFFSPIGLFPNRG